MCQAEEKEKKKKKVCYYQYTSGEGEEIVRHMPPGGGIENIRQ